MKVSEAFRPEITFATGIFIYPRDGFYPVIERLH